MEHKNNDIEMLLPRYCEGTATKEEQQQVLAWLQDSEENSRIVKQIEMLYLATDSIHIMQKVNTEKALSQVHQKMSGRKNIVWWKWTQRIAVILFLPLLTALLTQYFGGKAEVAQMLEARTNPGMTTSIVLPDSTVVYLNSESSLRYPSTFEGSTLRKVELKGEAYFEVTKNIEKHFIVATSHQSQIEVLGTSFNVEAYENTPEISTTLIKGKVNFHFLSNNSQKQVTLKPGQKAVYDSDSGTTRLYETSGETETSWKDGKIIFNNTPLKTALHVLEKRYNVVFMLTNSKLDDSFTGTFTNQRLEHILDYIKMSSNIRWRYTDTVNSPLKKTQIEIY